jgi:hypothetical protein
MAPTHPKASAHWPQTIVELIPLVTEAGWSEELITTLWATHELMARLFAGRNRGSGRPFLNHLAGTASLTLAHGGSPEQVLAAYAHSAYEQGEFGRMRPGDTPANRAELRAAIGAAAEALVVDYTHCRWESLGTRFASSDGNNTDGSDCSCLLLRVSNEIDETFDRPVYGAAWLEQRLDRLDEGAALCRRHGLTTLAHHAEERGAALRRLGPGKLAQPRTKGSRTIGNPGMIVRPGLALARRLPGLRRRGR